MTPEAEGCIEWVQRYARTRLNSRLADERACLPPNVLLDFGRRGLFGLTAPRELGGCGLPVGDAFRVLRQISVVDLSLGNMVGMHNFLGGRVILEHGSPEVRDLYAADFAMGRRLAAFALSEHGAGSDPRRIEARAVLRSDGSWRLSGRKLWCGLAAWAGVAAVFAQTMVDGRDGGITAFAVPLDALGVRHGGEAITLGLRSVVQSELEFDAVEIPASHVLGPVGKGMAVAQTGMMQGRLAMAVFGHAAMLRALSHLYAFVAERRISTGRMAENPMVAEWFTEECARTAALDRFLEWNFDRLDAGAPTSDLVYLAAKIVGPEEAWKTVDRCLQLMGGRGYVEPNGLARVFRDCRVIRIFEGPTEALTSYLGGLVGTKPEALWELLRSLNAADLQDPLLPTVSGAAPRLPDNRNLTRQELLRRQYRAGVATAAAIYHAVVRQSSTEIAVDLTRESFLMSLEDRPHLPMEFEPIFRRLAHLVGDIAEQKGRRDQVPRSCAYEIDCGGLPTAFIQRACKRANRASQPDSHR